MHNHSLQEKKRIVIDFIEKTNEYAHQKIKNYDCEIKKTVHAEYKKQSIQKKKEQWQSYILFNKYALKELVTNKLDPWFK